jgi:hypothetical protein
MTDAQKVEALTELLSTVMHTLEMTKYEIEDATESHKCETEADNFHQQMLDILHSEKPEDSVDDEEDDLDVWCREQGLT